MKFGQDLNEHLVPEWKAQYLDYKKGKKKLKQLKKKSSIIGSSAVSRKSKAKTGVSPSIPQTAASDSRQRTPSIFQKHSTQWLPSSNQQPKTPSSFKNGNSPFSQSRYQSISVVSPRDLDHGGFSLPAPAIDTDFIEHDSTTSNSMNNHEITVIAENNDTTPLLESSPSNNDINSNPNKLPKPPGISPNSFKTANSFLHTNDGSHRRHSTVSKIFDDLSRRASMATGLRPADRNQTELEDLSEYARKQFIAWVDSELSKVEDFYKDREDVCLERFLILQDQLFQLDEQKERSREKLKRIKALRARKKRDSIANGQSIDDDDDDDDRLGHDIAKSNFRFAAFIAKRKFRILNKFDWPSLSTFEWLREDGKAEKQYYEQGYYSDDDNDISGSEDEADIVDREIGRAQSTAMSSIASSMRRHNKVSSSNEQDPRFNKKDFSRKKKKTQLPSLNIPYFVARRQLKRAVYEFYRSMELLKSYRLLNRTAFRKIIKKYDKATDDSILQSYMKKVDSAYFSTSDVLDNLMTKVEEMFTKSFENGNRKIAVTKLRSSEVEEEYYGDTFNGGTLIGASIPMIAFATYFAIHRMNEGELPEGKFMLQIWAGFFLMVIMALFFAVNCMAWTKYKVNYKFIFEFNTRDALDYRQFMFMVSVFLFTLSILGWFSFHDFWPIQFNGRDWPWIYLGLGLFIFFCPFDILFLNTRIWMLSTFQRLILSGLYPVEFRDFFLGDIVCSLTYSISNMSMFFCLYGTHWKGCLDGSSSTTCGSSKSRVLGFLSTLPSIWRLLQCFRRYADTGDWFPHLANMAKYFCSILYYMCLSLYRIETTPKYRALLITFATVNSIFSSVWDLFMDWSLCQFGSENYLLRDELILKSNWIYYIAMIVDPILRFQWIFYCFFHREIQQSALTSFFVALAEVIRRGIWIFFRMENEHATNVHLYRASREIPLPYPIIKRRHLSKKKKTNAPPVQPSIIVPPPSSSADEEEIGDVESIQSYASDEERYYGTSSPPRARRRPSSMAAGLAALSRVITNAHIKDFQRRKVDNDNTIREEERSDEEDDDEGMDDVGSESIDSMDDDSLQDFVED